MVRVGRGSSELSNAEKLPLSYLYSVPFPWVKSGSKTDLEQEQGQKDSADEETGKQGRNGAQATLANFHSKIEHQRPVVSLPICPEVSSETTRVCIVPCSELSHSQNIS